MKYKAIQTPYCDFSVFHYISLIFKFSNVNHLLFKIGAVIIYGVYPFIVFALKNANGEWEAVHL